MAFVPILAAAVAASAGGGAAGYAFFRQRLPPETPYDIVINISSILELATKGWEVRVKEVPVVEKTKWDKFVQFFKPNAAPSSSSAASSNAAAAPSNAAAPATPLQALEVEGVCVAVIGIYNRGKSWLLNKICQLNLPSGSMMHTEGLSLLCPTKGLGRNLVLLDTAGGDTPIPNDKLVDSMATEMFLKELVIHLASVLVIVVNRLQRSDQRYLDAVKQNLRSLQQPGDRPKILLVVHNLKEVRDSTAARAIIDEEIVGTFSAKEQLMPLRDGERLYECKYWTSKVDDFHMMHFVFASDGSDAGKQWNGPSMDAIGNIFKTQTQFDTLDIFDKIFRFAAHRLPQYVSPTDDAGKLEIGFHRAEPRCVVASRRTTDNLDAPVADHNLLHFNPNIKTDAYGGLVGVSPLGAPGHWIPKYSLSQTEKLWRVVVDLGGIDPSTIVVDLKETTHTVTVKGNRLPPLPGDMIRNDIPDGLFELSITFPSPTERQNLMTAESFNGFLTLECPKLLDGSPKATIIKIRT